MARSRSISLDRFRSLGNCSPTSWALRRHITVCAACRAVRIRAWRVRAAVLMVYRPALPAQPHTGLYGSHTDQHADRAGQLLDGANTLGIIDIYDYTNQFFTGALVPLSLFPAWLRQMANMLPFQAQLHSALDLSGAGSAHDIPAALGIQVIWIVVLFALYGRWAAGDAACDHSGRLA